MLFGNDGNDTIRGGWGDDALIGGKGDDYLVGGLIGIVQQDDDNWIEGNQGNDTLLGYLGNDTLLGGQGKDLLVGAGGENVLNGGPGADIFKFGHGVPHSPTTLIGQDTIEDFGHGRDLIDLSNLNRVNNVDLAYSFIGQDAFSGSGPEVRYHWEGGNTVIELDTKSYFPPVDGVADGSILLLGHHTLHASDFIL